MDFEQKRNIGFVYLLENLSPKSGFGKKAVKGIAPYSDIKSLKEEQHNLAVLLKKLKANEKVFDGVNTILAHVKDIGGTFLRLGEALAETELFEIKNFCALSQNLKTELTKLDLDSVDLTLFDLKKPLEILDKSKTEGFYISDNHSKKLTELRAEKRRYTALMSNLVGEQREEMRLKHLDLSAKEEEEEFRLRKILSQKLKPYYESFSHNAKTMARLDLLIQKAFLAIQNNGILPIIDEEKFELNEAINPYIANLLNENGKTFSTISIIVSGVTVITGANMGGKTVALKTVALNAFCAMCGFPVFAKSAVLPFLNFVEILSEDLQSSERGLSSFGGEIIKVNQLFKQAKTSRGLLLIDEFASGTNFEEGAKIFSALLRALKNTPSYALLTTHFDGVCKDATERYQIIGLTNEAKQKLNNVKNVQKENIVEYMNYGLIKTDKLTKIPKDALDICAILGMCDEILSLVEKQ